MIKEKRREDWLPRITTVNTVKGGRQLVLQIKSDNYTGLGQYTNTNKGASPN